MQCKTLALCSNLGINTHLNLLHKNENHNHLAQTKLIELLAFKPSYKPRNIIGSFAARNRRYLDIFPELKLKARPAHKIHETTEPDGWLQSVREYRWDGHHRPCIFWRPENILRDNSMVASLLSRNNTKWRYKKIPMPCAFNMFYEVPRSSNKISKQKNEKGTTWLMGTHFLRADLQIQSLLWSRGASTAVS